MVRGEVWWANTPAGDRPVLVLTRDPLADRLGAVVVAACTTRIRGLRTELPLGLDDGMPEDCVASFDNIHTIDQPLFRSLITRLSPERMSQACLVLNHTLGCQPPE